MRKTAGDIVIILILIITALLWSISKNNILLSIRRDPLLMVSQLCALLGIILVSINLVMSSRNFVVEKIFGGLDKMYLLHGLTGSFAFLLILVHPLLLAIRALPDLNIASQYLFSGKDPIYNYGVFALYIMIFAFLFLLFFRIKYQYWKSSHKLLGAAFLLASMHALNIGSDIGNFDPLKIWISGFIALGLICFFYTLLLYKNFGPRFLYKIAKIDIFHDVISVYFTNTGKKMSYRPAQFAYFTFLGPDPGREQHPFTISSAPSDGMLRISAKAVGDFTSDMRNLQTNDHVLIYGPYGTFFQPYMKESSKKLLWIAGGIGITPFLSMIRAEQNSPTYKDITFYYVYKSEKDAEVFRSELLQNTADRPNIRIVFWNSSDRGLISVDEIIKDIPDLTNYKVQICGPPQMMNSLTKQLMIHGVKGSSIYKENFDLQQ